MLGTGIEFEGNKPVKYIGGLAREYSAVVIAAGVESTALVVGLDAAGEGLKAKENVVACGSVVRGACSAVQAVADGRRAALLVHNLP